MTHLFNPLAIRDITFANRVFVSPMCQYSSTDGYASDLHFVHLGSRAVGGAALVLTEATAVVPEGRISPQDLGIWKDDHIEPLARVVRFIHEQGSVAGMQLAHAGRKASTYAPWAGHGTVPESNGGWNNVVAPSALPFTDGYPMPRALSVDAINSIVSAFAAAARRACEAGFRVIELHAAHGYLIHEFLSPLSNQRTDAYGTDRLKFPLEVAAALRETWPKDRALGARISAHDWAEGGLGPDDAVNFARELKRLGFDYVCVSSAALVAAQKMPPITQGYQMPLAEKVRRAVDIKVRAVGMIADVDYAEEVIATGQTAMVALARAILDNPRWVWHAAERYGIKLDYPPSYARSRFDQWPGAKLARPEWQDESRV